MGQNDNVYWGLFYQKCDFRMVEKASSILEFLSKQDALFLPHGLMTSIRSESNLTRKTSPRPQ